MTIPGRSTDRRRLLAAVVVGVAAAAVTSCAAAPHGGLSYRDEGTEWCAPSETYDDVAVGIPLDTSDGATITVRDITGTSDGDIEIDQAYAVPVDPDHRIGLVAWPLDREWAEPWKHATQAEGTTIPNGTSVDLILHVARTGSAGGTISDVQVRYEQDGREYNADTFTRITITTSCD